MVKRFIDALKFKKGEITLNLTLIGYIDEDYFVIYSPALNLYGYGDNEKEAFQSFEETIVLYIDCVISEETLEKDLKKLGWKKQSQFKMRYNPPVYDPREIMSKKGVNSFNVFDRQLELQAQS